MEVITESEVSILELSKEELQDKYENLKKNLQKCLKSLEEKKQTIYDLQRELTRISSLEQEYIQEIEILQSNDKSEVKKFEGRISELQQELLDVKVKNRDVVLELEQVVLRKDEEIEGLKEKLAVSDKCKENAEKDAEHEKLAEENSALKEEMEFLVVRLKEKEDAFVDLSKQLEKVTLEKEEEYNNIQEILKAKKEELSEVKTLIETLQEENILMRNEMEMMRNKPSDTDARGNSLFAEVNDRRMQLQKNMDKMKSHYLEMKNENVTLKKQMAALKTENTFLSQQWKDDVIQREEDDASLIQSLRARIETLEELSNRLEKTMQERVELKTKEPSNELKCLEMMLQNKDKLLEEAWKKQQEQLLKLVCKSTELHNSNKELREWKSKAYHLKNKLAELETDEKDAKNEKVTIVCRCQEEKNDWRMKFLKEQQKSKKPQQAQPAAQSVELDVRAFFLGGDVKSKQKDEENDKSKQKGEEKENDLNQGNDVKGEDVADVIKMPLSITDESKETVKSEKKCVQFTEDTLDINKENAVRPKKRGNIISCPVVYISSVNKKE